MSASTASRIVQSLDELEPGDHIIWPTWWRLNDHHAIVVEVTTSCRHNVFVRVVHYSSNADRKLDSSSAEIKEELIDDLDEHVRRGALKVIIYQDGSCFSKTKTVIRARSRVGEVNYNLLQNNCEHFARWCKTGDSRSEQIGRAHV